jgi:tetratricopeptide (TPR) repeat protein
MFKPARPALSVVLSLFCGALLAAAFQAADQALVPGTVVERTLAAGQAHGFVVGLRAGDGLIASAGSAAPGKQLRLLSPAGDAIREMTIGLQGGGARPESVTFVAETAGDYRLEIRAASAQAAGPYTLALQSVGPASEADRLRAKAEQLYWIAQQVYAKRGTANFRQALAAFEETLPLWRTLGDQWFEGNVLAEIGGLHRLLAENQDALDYYERALPVLRSSGNRRDESGTLNNIAAVYYSRGEVPKAFDYFGRSLDVARAIGDRQAQSILLNNMGTLYLAQGEHQMALDLLNQALPLRRAVQDKSGEIRTLNNLSLIYRLLGDLAASKQSAETALSASNDIRDRQLQASSLNSLGTAERVLAEWSAAETHLQQALMMFRELGERRLVSATLDNLGELHQAQGLIERARADLRQALEEARAAEERQREAYILRNLGDIALAQSRDDEAIKDFEDSLAMEQRFGNADGEAESLRRIAQVFRNRGDLVQARSRSETALRLVESLRSKVSSPQLRTSYFSSKRPYYELHVDLLLHAGGAADPSRDPARIAEALEASERARARSLVDMLRESGIAIRQGIDPALLDRELTLRGKINVVESSRVRALADRPDPQRVAAIEKELDGLLAEYQQAESDIRERSPQYAALSQGETVRFADMQRTLDPDTAFLEYMLGDDRSYVWFVTNTSVEVRALPGRAAIEGAAREVYEALTARGRLPGRSASTAAGDLKLRESTARLSGLILGPLAERLDKRRLVVVSDGALAYVPFAALTSPRAATRPLILDHEVVHLPSMSSLLAMRRAGGTARPSDGSVAIIADPVFAPDDVRVSGRAVSQTAASRGGASLPLTRDLQRSAADRGVTRFPRLRFTRQEADGIAALVPPDRRT